MIPAKLNWSGSRNGIGLAIEIVEAGAEILGATFEMLDQPGSGTVGRLVQW